MMNRGFRKLIITFLAMCTITFAACKVQQTYSDPRIENFKEKQ